MIASRLGIGPPAIQPRVGSAAPEALFSKVPGFRGHPHTCFSWRAFARRPARDVIAELAEPPPGWHPGANTRITGARLLGRNTRIEPARLAALLRRREGPVRSSLSGVAACPPSEKGLAAGHRAGCRRLRRDVQHRRHARAHAGRSHRNGGDSGHGGRRSILGGCAGGARDPAAVARVPGDPAADAAVGCRPDLLVYGRLPGHHADGLRCGTGSRLPRVAGSPAHCRARGRGAGVRVRPFGQARSAAQVGAVSRLLA